MQHEAHDMVLDIDGVCAQLSMAVKTHKVQSEVVDRAIHSNSNSPFRPAYRWISHHIRKSTANVPHLLQNSQDLAKLIGRTFIFSGRMLMKIDVKDYFMSGEQPDLVSSSTSISPEYIREEVEAMVRFIVGN